MSELQNSWTKRTSVILDCPSGSRCRVMRPGPELALRVARLQRTLKPLVDISRVESEEEAEPVTEASMALARETVAVTVIEPRLYLNPGPEQVGVDDIDPKDFWFIFDWAVNGGRSAPVNMNGGAKTTVEAVETFPVESGSSAGAGDNRGDVPEQKSKSAARHRRK